MQPLSSSYHESGWPRWAFFAAVPVFLALGLIAGMAIATYSRRADQPAPPSTVAETPQQPGDPAQPPVPPPPTADSSWQIPGKPGSIGLTAPGDTPPLSAFPRPGSGPRTNAGDPSRTYVLGEPADAAEAAMALDADFGAYFKRGISFHVNYQQMRQSGQGVTVVGLMRVSSYADWTKALQENPAELTAWLQAAAARVQKAATRDRFFLSWAVVDVTAQRPANFADQEITALNDGTFLVIRPLAAAVDYAKTDISLRPLASLTAAAGGRVTAPDSPWASYGPALHWDSSDIFRPVPLGTKPFNR